MAAWPRLETESPGNVALGMATADLPKAAPDVVLVILDAYPRADTLRETFGIDNSAFEETLESMSFDVATQARSNYNKTWLTVETMLDARYVSENSALGEPPSGEAAQMRLLHEAIQETAVPKAFRARGYEIVTVQANVRSTELQKDADARSSGHMTSFEISLASSSVIARLFPEFTLDWLTSDMRADVGAQLYMLVDAATDAREHGKPRFIIAHVMMPHAPFLLGQSTDYLKGCFPRCSLWSTTEEEAGLSRPEFARRLGIQIESLNAAVADALRKIIADSPSAFVIVMSDHGIRHDLNDVDEHFRTLFAARTPGFDHLFPEDVSPVNVFRRVLTATFGEDLPDLDYKGWVSDWYQPLDLIPRQ
jgi:hypothetical protein